MAITVTMDGEPLGEGRKRRRPTVQSRMRNQNHRRNAMTQKIIEVVGTSKESFAKAAENAVAEAAKTVRGMKWARVAELEMELDGKKIANYRTTTKIYFDIEK
jgi:dodecin